VKVNYRERDISSPGIAALDSAEADDIAFGKT